MDLTIATSHSLKQLYNRYAYLHNRTKDEKLEHYGFGAKDTSELNWLSFDDIENNISLLDHWQYSSIRALLNEANSFDRDEKGKIIPNPTTYVGNTIMAQMAGFEYAKQMTWCGTTGNLQMMKSTPCSKWKYCERCADQKRKYAFVKYAHVYSSTPDPCYFITISPDLSRKVIFTEQNMPLALAHWDKMNAYVDSMYSVGVIKGAVIVEEASFDSYYPQPILNPHLHLVCVANSDGLKSHRFDGMKIDVKLIDNEYHWVKGLNYLHKSIQFFHTYNHEWTKDKAEVINRNFRDMLNNHKNCVSNRNQTRAIGILHGRNKKSMVVSTKVMKEQKKARQLAEKKLESDNMFEDFKNGAQSRLKREKEKSANIIDVESTPVSVAPVKKKETRPFYKNPWVIGGGLLAGAAGMYGAGKMYNDGNNALNNTFGKAIDDYAVNPIKSLFTSKPVEGNTAVEQKPAPVIKGKPDFYQLAADLGRKPDYTGEFPNLQGISPLRPELQLKGLVSNPENKRIIEENRNFLTSQQNLKSLIHKANSFINGGVRTMENSTEFNGKTPEEVEGLKNIFQKDYDHLSKTFDSGTASSYNDKNLLSKFIRSSQGSAVQSGVEKTLSELQGPATIYDWGYEPATMLANKYPAVLEKAKNVLGPAGPVVGKTLNSLNPLTAGLGSGYAGWNLGEDIANDPGRLEHKSMAALGLSPESMKYMSAGAHGGSTAAFNALLIPKLKNMLTKSLAKGLVAGEATSLLSPPVATAAAITTSMASPIADGLTDYSTNNFNTNQATGDLTSTLYNQFDEAKKQMDSQRNAFKMQGLLASNNFRRMFNTPEEVKNLIDTIGPGPANAMLTAKNEGVMGLLTKKITDLIKDRKYIPQTPSAPSYYPTAELSSF